ncbi:MAG: hypothetical protein H6517_06880 [Microthrixaceae bacterium]|nr:hypothetical protein [Microthrixaceae bacterium]MCO5321184.1 hypothetical protein [Microthrixaceae bacterium]
MANNPIGPLLAADESLTHQVADTFAIVGTSDPAWTEKICAMAMARDGSLQIGFGLGRYPNRNVLDAYAAASRGAEQLTVRGSRSLSSDPESTSVGPIRYEVVEPLQKVRFCLEANEVQPIAFDIEFDSVVPAQLEERSHLRNQYRVSADLVRYHQTGVASGWVELDGERTEVDPHNWVSTRDHSWGVRYDVGPPPPDRADEPAFPAGVGFMMIWCPALMERSDGSRYAVHLHFTLVQMPGFEQKTVTAGVEHPDGTVDQIVDLQPDLRFDPENRRLLGGTVTATMGDGSERPFGIEVLGDTGVQLGAGLYFGLDGHHHGEWRGEFHTDGERIADCRPPEVARRLHQIRDTAVRVTDPVGGGQGWGNCQPIAAGPWPELGLADDPWM